MCAACLGARDDLPMAYEGVWGPKNKYVSERRFPQWVWGYLYGADASCCGHDVSRHGSAFGRTPTATECSPGRSLPLGLEIARDFDFEFKV